MQFVVFKIELITKASRFQMLLLTMPGTTSLWTKPWPKIFYNAACATLFMLYSTYASSGMCVRKSYKIKGFDYDVHDAFICNLV